MHNVCRLHYWPAARYMDATCNPNVVKDPIVREMRRRYTYMDNFQTDHFITAAVKLTAEESEERANILTDVETYVRENMIKFITGELSVENDWDAYVNGLKTFKLDQAIAIMQDAYDRSLAR